MFEVEEESDGGGEEGAPAWMATFSDLATLLLTFFVLLLSFANTDVRNFRVALGSVKEAMGVQHLVAGELEGLTTSILELSPRESGPHISIDDLAVKAAEKVQKYVEAHGLENAIEVEASPRGIILRTRDAVLFRTGQDEVVAEGGRILSVVANLFKSFKGELSIQGHTDSVPITSSRFPSNWELSTARATAVMRYLTREYDADIHRLQVAGYADTKPLAEGSSAAARRRNRRVEFLFQFPVKDGALSAQDLFHLTTGGAVSPPIDAALKAVEPATAAPSAALSAQPQEPSAAGHTPRPATGASP